MQNAWTEILKMTNPFWSLSRPPNGDFSQNAFHSPLIINPNMEKVKKLPLAEFLGLMISAKKCVILDMSKAMEKCENRSIFSKVHIRNIYYGSMKILHST